MGLRGSPPNFRVTGETIDSFGVRDGVFGPTEAKRPIVEGNVRLRELVGVSQAEADVQAEDIIADMKRKGLSN